MARKVLISLLTSDNVPENGLKLHKESPDWILHESSSQREWLGTGAGLRSADVQESLEQHAQV